MEHRIVLAWEQEDYDRADRVWRAVEGQVPISVAALEDLVDTFTALYQAEPDLVKDDRYFDWKLRVTPKMFGEFVFKRGPYVIPNRDEFLEYIRQHPGNFLEVRDALIWTVEIPIRDSAGQELFSAEAHLGGMVHADRVEFDRGGYSGVPQSVMFLPLAREVDKLFSVVGHEPDFSWDFGEAKRDRDAVDWEKQWLKKARGSIEIGEKVKLLVGGEYSAWETTPVGWSVPFRRSLRSFWYVAQGKEGLVAEYAGGFGAPPRAIVRFDYADGEFYVAVPFEKLEVIGGIEEWEKQWEKKADTLKYKPGDNVVFTKTVNTLSNGLHKPQLIDKGTKGEVLMTQRYYSDNLCKVSLFKLDENSSLGDVIHSMVWTEEENLELVDSPAEWAKQWEKRAEGIFNVGVGVTFRENDRAYVYAWSQPLGTWVNTLSSQNIVPGNTGEVVGIDESASLRGWLLVKMNLPGAPIVHVPPNEHSMEAGYSSEDWERQWEKVATMTKRAVDMREWFRLRYGIEPEQNPALYQNWKWRDEQGLSWDRMDDKGKEIYRKLQQKEWEVPPDGGVQRKIEPTGNGRHQ